MRSIFTALCLLLAASQGALSNESATSATANAADGGRRQWIASVQLKLLRTVTHARGFPRSDRRVVTFSLDRQGRISDVQVVERQHPDARLDALTVRIVTKAAPFPPMPTSIHEDHLTFRLPLRFR